MKKKLKVIGHGNVSHAIRFILDKVTPNSHVAKIWFSAL
jgi:hypothetical protein